MIEKNNPLSNISQDSQEKIFSELMDLSLERTIKEVFSGLDDKDKKEMQKAFSSADNKTADKFIKKHFPGFQAVFKQKFKETFQEFKNRMLNK